MHLQAALMPSTRRTWTAGTDGAVPLDLTGVRWPDGTLECRFRLLHPAGSLVAVDGELGIVLTNHDAACTTCSDACAD